MTGVCINVAAVLLGGGLGLLLKKGISEPVSKGVMIALGLCVLLIGIDGALQGQNTVVLVLSMAAGAALGAAVDLQARMEHLGEKMESALGGKGQKGAFAQGFVASSLLFCVGAMAVVGALQAGLLGENKILITKAIIDGIAACMLASTFGVGVLFSALCLLVYEGALALLAGLLSPLLSNAALLAEITCAGSLMIVAIGLNMLGICKIKVANLLPGLLFVPLFFCLASFLPL